MKSGTNYSKFKLNVNGKPHEVYAAPMARLLDVLRIDLKLTGSKEGCGEGECGACSVLIDDKVVNSCLVPIVTVGNSLVTTIEGLTSKEAETVKKAFTECNGAQCGICTPGMIISATTLLKKNNSPSLSAIREELSGNLCRCTGYTGILAAVESAATMLRENS